LCDPRAGRTSDAKAAVTLLPRESQEADLFAPAVAKCGYCQMPEPDIHSTVLSSYIYSLASLLFLPFPGLCETNVI